MTTTLKTASFAFQKCFRCHLGFSTDSPPLLFESVSVALPCVRCTHTSEFPIWRLAYSIGCVRLKNWWKQIGWLSAILNSSQKILPWWWFGCRFLQLVPVLISTRISLCQAGQNCRAFDAEVPVENQEPSPHDSPNPREHPAALQLTRPEPKLGQKWSYDFPKNWWISSAFTLKKTEFWEDS